MMLASKAATTQHIATIEAERNKQIPLVRKDLATVFAPVRQVVKDGKDASVVQHAIATLTAQKSDLALAVAKAYEDASQPMVKHTLKQLAQYKPVEQNDSFDTRFNSRVTQYVSGILPNYTDRVLASFAAQAADLAAQATKARPASFPLVATPVVPYGAKRTYRAVATRHSTHRKSSPVAQSETSDDFDEEDDTEGELALFDELDGLIDDALDIMSEMVAVTAGNLGMFASADAWSGDSGIDLVKVWQALVDRRTRPSHAAADGQSQLFEDPFDVGGSLLLFPLDDSLGADIAEIIYCRCVVVFEPAYTKARRDQARQWGERMLRIVHDHGRATR
jgi:hypothetical protein